MADVWEWLTWLGLAVVVIAVVEAWLKNRGLPPGPWGLPFVGYYFFIHPKLIHVTLTELSERYGDLFSLRSIGGTLFIVLNRATIMKEVLVSRADEFIGRPLQMNFVTWVDGGYGIVQTEGDVWKEQRRFFLTTAKTYGFGKTDMEDFIHELIQEMIGDLRKASKNNPVSLPLHMSHVTGNIISRVLCGKSIKKNDPKFLALTKGNYDLVFFLSDRRLFLAGPILEHIYLKLTPGGKRLQKTTKLLEEFAEEIVEEHVRAFDSNNPKDFIDSYLLHLKRLEEEGKLEGSSFSMLRLKKVFLGMFLEAAETVSSTLCTLLPNLALQLEAQKKAQKELDEVVGRDRLPSWLDKKNLPYLDALILELYRTGIIFFVSPYYSNFEETTIRGYRIPKRSFIIVNFYSAHNDPKVYPNPSKFDPGRFLGEEGQRIKQEPPIPFGVGKRSCIGEALASMEVFLIISAVLQNFTLYPAEGDKVRMEPR